MKTISNDIFKIIDKYKSIRKNSIQFLGGISNASQ